MGIIGHQAIGITDHSASQDNVVIRIRLNDWLHRFIWYIHPFGQSPQQGQELDDTFLRDTVLNEFFRQFVY